MFSWTTRGVAPQLATECKSMALLDLRAKDLSLTPTKLWFLRKLLIGCGWLVVVLISAVPTLRVTDLYLALGCTFYPPASPSSLYVITIKMAPLGVIAIFCGSGLPSGSSGTIYLFLIQRVSLKAVGYLSFMLLLHGYHQRWPRPLAQRHQQQPSAKPLTPLPTKRLLSLTKDSLRRGEGGAWRETERWWEEIRRTRRAEVGQKKKYKKTEGERAE